MMRGLEMMTIGAMLLVLLLGFGPGPERTSDPAAATNLPTASGLAWND
jgi:hypothetical protein